MFKSVVWVTLRSEERGEANRRMALAQQMELDCLFFFFFFFFVDLFFGCSRHSYLYLYLYLHILYIYVCIYIYIHGLGLFGDLFRRILSIYVGCPSNSGVPVLVRFTICCDLY